MKNVFLAPKYQNLMYVCMEYVWSTTGSIMAPLKENLNMKSGFIFTCYFNSPIKKQQTKCWWKIHSRRVRFVVESQEDEHAQHGRNQIVALAKKNTTKLLQKY
jgi:hypothetical protein